MLTDTALSQRRTPAPEAETDTSVPPRESDDQLLGRIARGEQDALACLFQRYRRVVHSIGARILRDTAEAEDFLQDLFLFIRRKSFIFDCSKSSGGSWIVHMAYQRAIDRRRRLATRQFYNGEHFDKATAFVVGTATTEEDYSPAVVFGRNGLDRIIGELSEAQRETLRLYFFEGYTLAEISKKLGQPLPNTRNHYYRGLDRVRKQMFEKKA